MEIKIEANKRETTGKGYARKLRQKGLIPANIVNNAQSTPIELDPKLLSKAWQKNDKKFTLVFEGQEKLVKIHELQINPVKRTAIHVDLTYA